MTFPQKNTRKITVDGVQYYWHLNQDFDLKNSWLQIIPGKSDGQLLQIYPYSYELEIRPKMIEQAIRYALENDWRLDKKREAFMLDFNGTKFEDLGKILKLLGYHRKWIDYGFLMPGKLYDHYLRYKKARQNPDEDLDGDRHTEHLRHESFYNFIKNKDKFTDKEVKQLVELVELDEDTMMAQNAFKYLVELKRVDDKQIKKFNLS